MILTDFLGKEYGPGDLVLYAAMSGRCPNIVIGRVEDIYEVYRDDHCKWKRLAEGELPPFKKKYSWFDADGNMVDKRPESGGERRAYTTEEREETFTRVKIQPLRGARWKQHHGRKRYIDTRSGKGINPDAPSGVHVLKDSHFVYADGTEFDWEAEKAKWEARNVGQWRRKTFDIYFRKRYHINYEKPGSPPRFPLHESEAAKEQLWYVSRTYQPWVKRVDEGPAPVTLEITDNIVKWEGELPDADVPVQVP